MKIKLLAFLLLFGMTRSAFAGRIPPDNEIELLEDFSGGLNTVTAPHKIPKNYSPHMLNSIIDQNPGTIIQPTGFTEAGSTNTLRKVNFLFTIFYSSGSVEYLVSDSSIVLATADFRTYTTVRTGLNFGSKLNAVQVRDKVWITDGVGPVFTYNGSTVVVLDGQTYSGNVTPSVPRGKYLAYYQGRVFVYGTATNPSGLHFCEIVSTDTIPIAIAPDSANAWPATNLLQISQGDGTIGTAIWDFKGQLHLGKESSIYQLFGTNVNNFTAKKTESKIGPISQDSVRVLDNYTYFYSRDGQGVYKFNGVDSERITGLIENEMAAVAATLTNVVSDFWDTKADFDRGTFSNSVSTSAGYLTLPTSSPVTIAANPAEALDGVAPSYLAIDCTPVDCPAGVSKSRLIDFSTIVSHVQGDVELSSYITRVNPVWIFYYRGSQGVSLFSGTVTIRNANSLQMVSSTFNVVNPPNSGANSITINFSSAMGFTRGEVLGGSLSIRMDCFATAGSNGIGMRIVQWDQLSFGGSGSDLYVNATTGTFASQIATATTISSWDLFQAADQPNGGLIKYFIRTSSALNMMSNREWISITPGNSINQSTNSFIQWSTTMTVAPGNLASPSLAPIVDNVTIQHNEGGSSDTLPFAYVWKNNYNLVVTTEANSVFSKIYRKSRITNPVPDAWMPIGGIDIRSFTTNTNETIYGGSSSSGTIYRLDYGTNFNGNPIPMIYRVPQLFLNSNYFEKTIFEYVIDVDENPMATLTIGTSVNGGAFSNRTISIDGTGRLVRSLYNLDKIGKFFQIELSNSELDKTIRVNSLGIIYQPLPLR